MVKDGEIERGARGRYNLSIKDDGTDNLSNLSNLSGVDDRKGPKAHEGPIS
jgi:hypothetical protein